MKLSDYQSDQYQPIDDTEPLVSSKAVPAPFKKFAAFLIFLFPAMGGLLFGYDIGATSAVITQLKSRTYSNTTW